MDYEVINGIKDDNNVTKSIDLLCLDVLCGLPDWPAPAPKPNNGCPKNQECLRPNPGCPKTCGCT